MSFCIIRVVNSKLAEVIVNEGAVIDEIEVAEYHDVLLNVLDAPFSLLINKLHAYTYTFKAQRSITDLKELKAVAIVVKTAGAILSTETLIQVSREVHDNIKLFRTREEALNWLKKK
ncbi:hypothetical protein [Algibacter pacificus]|uniref:hypothetical protein n=1 Tax=Algibacter pacificus TaxID=2599389 RepID=UPI0011C77201|nr:hypothetical protein [Algibacter pacificus]